MHSAYLRSLAFIFLTTAISRAEDWPQILGPQRNGASSENVPASLDAMKVVWNAPVGQGYAGPVIVGDRVVLFHRIKKAECVTCWSVSRGTILWNTEFPATYAGGVDADLGPRATPVVVNDRVYVYGAGGDCHALDLTSGKTLWSRELSVDYEAPDGYFGAGSSPLLLSDRLILNVGGRNAGIVGLNVESGKTEFAIGKELASYASPVAWKTPTDTVALFVTRFNVVTVHPQTGASQVLFAFGKAGPTVNAASPLVKEDQLFVTASYGVGAKAYAENAILWENDTALSSQYVTPVERNNYVYGIHGREDIPPAHLRCIAWKTGKIAWSQDEFGIAHLILANDKLLIVTLQGELVVASASPEKYIELARQPLPKKGVYRALPALSNGHLFLRSNVGEEDRLYCIKLAN